MAVTSLERFLNTLEYIRDISHDLSLIFGTLVFALLFVCVTDCFRAAKYRAREPNRVIRMFTIFDDNGRMIDPGLVLLSLRRGSAPDMAITPLDVVEYFAEISQTVYLILATLAVSTLYSWTRSFLRANKYSSQHACAEVYRNTVFDGEGRVLDKGDLLFSIRNSDAPVRRSE